MFYRRRCIHSYSLTIRWSMGVLDDHGCESALFWRFFVPEARSWQ